MNTIHAIIDGTAITSRAKLHSELAAQLDLPWWYGRNLDALYDCLVDVDKETEVRLVHRDELFANLGVYADVLETVLRDACEENPRLRLVVEGAAEQEG